METTVEGGDGGGPPGFCIPRPHVAEFCFVSGLESLSREDLLVLVEMQQRTIQELTKSVANLSAKIEELENQSNRNSGNSSMPPSSDMFAKPARSVKPKQGRKRGKQPGSPGSGRALVADPEAVFDEFPAVCGGCGVGFAGLTGTDSAGFTRRQCHDIPVVSVAVSSPR